MRILNKQQQKKKNRGHEIKVSNNLKINIKFPFYSYCNTEKSMTVIFDCHGINKTAQFKKNQVQKSTP